MAALPSSRWLKSTEWLAGELGKPEVAVIDGSYYLPTQNRDASGGVHCRSYSRRGCSSTSMQSPIIRPTCLTCCRGRTMFGAAAGELEFPRRIRSSSMTAPGFIRRPRVRWTFRIFGRRNVYILDGGLPAWEGGRPGDRSRRRQAPEKKRSTPNGYRRRSDAHRRADGAQRSKRAGGRCTLSRALCRARARARAGLRSGLMPGAFSLPSPRSWRTAASPRPSALRRPFKESRRRPRQTVNHSCGSA